MAMIDATVAMPRAAMMPEVVMMTMTTAGMAAAMTTMDDIFIGNGNGSD